MNSARRCQHNNMKFILLTYDVNIKKFLITFFSTFAMTIGQWKNKHLVRASHGNLINTMERYKIITTLKLSFPWQCTVQVVIWIYSLKCYYKVKVPSQRLRCHQTNDVMFITNAFCITYNDHWSVIKKKTANNMTFMTW